VDGHTIEDRSVIVMMRRKAPHEKVDPYRLSPTMCLPVRDIASIDGDLRLVSRACRVARQYCDGVPNSALIDQLLDERAAMNRCAMSDGSGVDGRWQR
jgi:hypothetical protein